MKINSVNPYVSKSFKHKILLDVGASNPKGTLKVLSQSDNGDVLFKKTGLYVNDTVDGFESKQTFIDKIAKVIKETHLETLKKANEGEINLSPSDRKLSGVALFVPGTTYPTGKDNKDDVIKFIPNLKDKEGKSLVDVHFADYEKDMKTKSASETGIDVNKDEFEFIATKDLGGCGLSIAKILGAKNQLKEGDYIMGVMTGGGFGSVDIKVKNGKVEFETSESSSYLTAAPNGGKLEKLGRLGVSVKSHINHYCDELNLPELARDSKLRKAIISSGDARIVEMNEMHINNSDDELINELLASPLFQVKEKNEKKTIIEMKADTPEMQEKMQNAKISSFKDYAEAVSLISVNKINDCLNKVILVGPFAQGVNKYIKNHPEEFQIEGSDEKITDLPDLIKHEVKKRIDDVDLPSSRWLSELYNFDVICDSEINFPDNTFAGDLLLNKNLNFVENRGSWFSIPLSEVQK